MASRAVYLEVAYSLDTDNCINALRRFICRRGQVSHLRSDNGTHCICHRRRIEKGPCRLELKHDAENLGIQRHQVKI